MPTLVPIGFQCKWLEVGGMLQMPLISIFVLLGCVLSSISFLSRATTVINFALCIAAVSLGLIRISFFGGFKSRSREPHYSDAGNCGQQVHGLFPYQHIHLLPYIINRIFF